MGFSPISRYSSRHSLFRFVHRVSRPGFDLERNAPLPRGRAAPPTASAPGLVPVHLRRAVARLVSYYALFKGWLLLSQPPSCLSDRTAFLTEPGFGGLSWWSALFRPRQRRLSPAVSLPRNSGPVFGV